MLTTTLFLDFGLGIGFDGNTGNQNTLTATVDEIRNVDGAGINGNGTGPRLEGRGNNGGLEANSDLDFRPINYDFNNDSVVNNADLTALSDAVVPLVRRAVEPFDIEVVVAAATSLADIVTSLDANNAETDGDNDAYSWIVDAVSDFFGGGSVGDNASSGDTHGSDLSADGTNLFGIAAADDLLAQGGNDQDELALTFADTVKRFTTGNVTGSAFISDAFNENLANRIAYTATHEAFHTFSFAHTVRDNPTITADDDEALMSNGDVIRRGATADARENSFIVTRLDLAHDQINGVDVVEPNNYLLAANDPDIGLRDANDNNIPDLAYITGTGAHDLIQLGLDPANSNIVDVTITPFSDANGTTQILRNGDPLFLNYEIRLDTVGAFAAETDGTILIDSSLGNDRIEIDAGIAADFRIRTLLGNDEIAILGADDSRYRSLIVEGEDGDDTLEFDLTTGNAFPQVGTDLAFAGSEGTDSTLVIEDVGGTPTNRDGFFVDTNIATVYNNEGTANLTITSPLGDAPDNDFNDGVADTTGLIAGDQITLRAAVQQANQNAGPAYIFLPPAKFDLTEQGGENQNASRNDLDITSEITIVGSGAGRSIIDAVGGTAGQETSHKRVFHVHNDGSLDLSHMTLTGGNVTTSGGGAIRVESPATSDGEMNLSHVALVNNRSTGIAGGLYLRANTSANLVKSVITDNESGSVGGGTYLANGTTPATITLEQTVLASNDASGTAGEDLYAATQGSSQATSIGGNLIGSVDNAHFTALDTDTALASTPTDLHVVTALSDTTDTNDNGFALTLREAIALCNVGPLVDHKIWVPGWEINLTDETAGHFMINRDITLTGVGAGGTILDASEMNDRHFRVLNTGGELGLVGMTLTGGFASGGGAIFVDNDAGDMAIELELNQVAIVNNYSDDGGSGGVGGAISVGNNTDITITSSVIANDVANGNVGGGIFTKSGSSTSLENTIVANNSDGNGGSGTDLYGPGFSTLGGNRFTSVAGSNLETDDDPMDPANYDPLKFLDATDHLNLPDENDELPVVEVVTSLFDTFDHTDNDQALSLREAVDLAHEDTTIDELWLPAWDFLLTRDRATFGGGSTTDTNVAFGDLDISRSLTLRGVDGQTSADWLSGADNLGIDSVFTLLGDYDHDGASEDTIDGEDYTLWQQQNGSSGDIGDFAADGNQDGEVDSADFALWNNNYGNELKLLGVQV